MSLSDYISCTPREYIASKTSLEAKIVAIDKLIDAMILDTIDAEMNPPDWVSNAGTASYMMDDGQMRVNTVYRSVDAIVIGIKALERLKQIYVNRFNGPLTVTRGRLNY